MTKRLALFGLFLGGLLAAAPAQASQISGTIGISQNNCPSGQNCMLPVGGVNGLADATALDFTTTGVATPNVVGSFVVDTATGDFAAANLQGLTGAVKDFCFTATGCGVYLNTPITNFLLLTGGAGGSFDLATVGILFQSVDALTLKGTGTFKAGGFDPTAGTFVFSSTRSSNGANTTFSFSGTGAAIPTPGVPEPGSMILLGTGLLGLGYSMRSRFARK